jgi:hypothetical protein
VAVAAALFSDPASSIPVAMKQWSQSKALYRFMSNKEVSHAMLLDGHIQATVERCSQHRRILVAHDTTHCSYGGRREGGDLGPVDTTGETRGFLAHSALAFTPDSRLPLGILGQRVWVRDASPHGREESQFEREKRHKESEKWGEVARSVDQAFSQAGSAKPIITDVFDGEGDHFATIETLRGLGHDFIIRATRDRLLDVEAAQDEDEGAEEYKYISEAAALAPVLGTVEVTIPVREGRPERRARLELRSVGVHIMPPKISRRVGDPIEVGLVYASEIGTLPEGEPICLLLLTGQPATSVADAYRTVQEYLFRWIIEEFHKALKTGCSLEKRELRTFHRLTNLLAILGPIAVQMLRLRHMSRQEPQEPASASLNPLQLEALRLLRPEVPTQSTARQALRAIAGIGGFLGRKADGEPGWLTLWRGFRDLLLAERVLTRARTKPPA